MTKDELRKAKSLITALHVSVWSESLRNMRMQPNLGSGECIPATMILSRDEYLLLSAADPAEMLGRQVSYCDGELRFLGILTIAGDPSHGRFPTNTIKKQTAKFVSPIDVKAFLRSAVDKVYEQREEILAAFVAKHGFDPDKAEQVEERSENGVRWFIRDRSAGLLTKH